MLKCKVVQISIEHQYIACPRHGNVNQIKAVLKHAWGNETFIIPRLCKIIAHDHNRKFIPFLLVGIADDEVIFAGFLH